MGDKKKHKDKKDKKKHKEKDRQKQRQRQRQKKDRKKRDKKRSYSSDSSSSDSSSDSSSSSSRQRTRKKDSKKIKKDKKQTKTQTKVINPYDFDNKTIAKSIPSFPMGPMNIPTPIGFSLPTTLHTAPPPPITPISSSTHKPKTKQINIFKLLPKLPYGAICFSRLLYSTQFIEQKAYNILLEQMMNQIEIKAKQENHKKAISIIGKCKAQIKRQIQLSEAEKEKNNQEREIMDQNNINFDLSLRQNVQQSSRFKELKRIYSQMTGQK